MTSAIRAPYKLIKSTNLLMQNKQSRDEYVKGKETYYFVDIRIGAKTPKINQSIKSYSLSTGHDL
jgi:hypothetical protein